MEVGLDLLLCLGGNSLNLGSVGQSGHNALYIAVVLEEFDGQIAGRELGTERVIDLERGLY